MRQKTALFGLLAGALALSGACKKDKEQEEEDSPKATETEKDEATEPAKEEQSGEDVIEIVESCTNAFAAWEKEKFRGCFTEDVEAKVMDGVPPQTVKGQNKVLVNAGSFRNAFPDLKMEVQAIIANGSKAVNVTHMSGTHTGRSLGMPPTNKKVSMSYAQVIELNDEGKYVRSRDYNDQATLFHQLGIQESVVAPDKEKPWPEKARVAAAKDSESPHVELVKSSLEAISSGKLADATAVYADDAVYRYMPEAQAYEGKADIKKGLEDYVSLNEDFQVSVRDIWAAGDWVVAETTSTGTLATNLAGIEGTKGKSWEQNSLELFKFEDKKVKRHMVFANGLKFAADVGLFDPSMLGPPGGGGGPPGGGAPQEGGE